MKIDKLIVYTSQLNKQVEFYTKVLQLKLNSSSQTHAEFKIGASTLVFQYNSSAKPYHFAINIPSNKEHEALAWLKQRLSPLPFQGNELVDFVNWNAKSMYFYDADNNIVEFIARKNQNINVPEEFNEKQLLRISEIGLAVINVEQTYNAIKEIREVGFYFGNLEHFCAAGDEDGLFIIIDKDFKGWMPNNDPAHTSDFVLYGDLNLAFLNGEIFPLNETH